jgi:hypothetical protein
MSDEPFDAKNMMMGETERLLLEHKRVKDLGLVQELGRTIKKDGLDGIRALIWAFYGASNVVFPIMFVTMMGGIVLNLSGYGYYWDDHGLVIDTLEHIRQDNLYQQELLKLSTTSGYRDSGM